jgi:hypothetical protein
MLYVTETKKDVETAARDLAEAVKQTGSASCMCTICRGRIRPTALLALFPGAPDLKPVAEEVERETIRMIDEAR